MILLVLLEHLSNANEEFPLVEHVVRDHRSRTSWTTEYLCRCTDEDNFVLGMLLKGWNGVLEEVVRNRDAAVRASQNNDCARLLGFHRQSMAHGGRNGMVQGVDRARYERTVMETRKIKEKHQQIYLYVIQPCLSRLCALGHCGTGEVLPSVC